MTRTAVSSKELELFIVGPKESFKASRIQRIGFTTNIPNTVSDELGNSLHAGTSKDTADVTVTFSAFDVGVKIFSVLTGTDYTAYPGAGVDISSLGQMDAILEVKNSTAASYAKSAHARKLQIQSFAYSYSVGGDSTEDYTAVGSSRRWLKYDVVVDKFTTGTGFTLSKTPLQLLNGNKLLSVIADGVYLTEVSAGATTGQYSVSGTTLTLGVASSSQCLAIYHANASTAWSDITDASMPADIKGRNVPVYISTNNIDRVQSVTINGAMNTTAVKEQGNVDVVGYQSQVPDVTGTLTVLDTDTDLISLLTNGTIGSGIEWQPGEGCSTTPLTLKVALRDPCAPTTILKTIFIPSITITNEGYTANVNQNAQIAYQWRSNTGACLIFSGAHAG
jgi:hypothetical protein